MTEPNLTLLERESVQLLPDAKKNSATGDFWAWDQGRTELLSPFGSRQREKELRLWDRHPQMWIWQGAVAGLIKKVASAPREIKGGRNNVGYFDSILRYANFGLGWDDFISKGVRDFFRQDGGWYFEIIGPGNPRRALTGRVTGIAHLDSIRCFPTGDPEFPVVYYNREGVQHLMHHTRVVHIVDMPDGDESKPGYGLCALSRGISIATQELHMNRYVQTMLDDKPQPGYAITNNINEGQRLANFEKYKQEVQRDELPLWGRTIWFPGLDPAAKPSIEFITFSQAPPAWDYQKYTELHINAWALALGIDVQELWQLTGGNIGSGQQSQVLHAKSQGKTFGDLLTKLERALNTYVLPESLEFEFKRHDPYESDEKATTAGKWASFAKQVETVSTPDEIRRLLADTVEPYKNVVTNEDGEVVSLPDQDVKPADEDLTIDDAAPDQPAQDENNQPEATQDDAKAFKSIQATRLNFEADWGDLVNAGRKGDMTSRRFDIVARAQLAKSIRAAYEDGLTDGGVEDGALDDEDNAEVLSLVAKANSYVTDLTSAIYGEAGISEAEAALKPQMWWNLSVSPSYDAGRLSADRNGMYELVGDDGEKTCPTCKRLKGQIHRMRDWARKQLRPGIDSHNYECVNFNCKHKLVKVKARARGSW